MSTPTVSGAEKTIHWVGKPAENWDSSASQMLSDIQCHHHRILPAISL
jgi:hypothetical protein